MKQTLFRSTIVAVVAVFCLTNVVPLASAKLLDNCADILVLFARGSSQNSPDNYSEQELNDPNGDFAKSGIKNNEGETLQFFKSIRARINPSLKTDYISLHNFEGRYNPWGYQAAGGETIIKPPEHRQDVATRYHESVKDGAEELTWFLEDRMTSCPLQQIVLGGYSQGAQVVGEAAEKLQPQFRPRLAYTAMYGDPKFNPIKSLIPLRAGWWVRGNAKTLTQGVLGGRKNYIPDGIASAGSWCESGDTICDAGILNITQPYNILLQLMSGTNKHTTAYRNNWIEKSAPEITSALQARIPTVAENTETGVFINKNDRLWQLDLAVVIDTAQSMDGKLQEISNRVSALSSNLFSAYWDTRVGVVAYDVPNNSYYSNVVVPFTHDQAAVRSGLTSLQANGSNQPRALYAGLRTAMSNLSWRAGAQKKIIVITDSPGTTPDPSAYQVTEEQLQRQALELDPVVVNMADISCDKPVGCEQATSKLKQSLGISTMAGVDASAATRFVQPLLEDSNGAASKVNPAIDDISQLAGLLKTMEMQPAAAITGDKRGYLNTPLALSADESYDPDSALKTYRWDCNDDGVWDLEQAYPYAECTFDRPYRGLVVMEVVSKDGGSSKATWPIVVAGQAPKKGPAPTVPQVIQAYSHKGLKLSWQANYPKDTVIRVSDAEGNILGYARSTDKGVLLGTLGRKMTGLQIAAGNANGWSAEQPIALDSEKLKIISPENNSPFAIISSNSLPSYPPANAPTIVERLVRIILDRVRRTLGY